MSKRYHPGRAAETGVLAAGLARAGFSGPARVFEAEWGGFLPLYAGDRARPQALTDGLGTEFLIMRSGVKPYASCRGAHAALDVILDVKRRERLEADAVAAVRIRCTEQDRMMLGDAAPRTRLAAQMSLPYGVAVACVAGRASIAEYEEPWLRDPRVRELMRRVTLTVDPALPVGAEAHVVVETRDGRRFAGHVEFARGAPENPLPRGEVLAKYDELAARGLSPEGVRTVKEAVLALDEPDGLRRLQDGLTRVR
jgi:2-methylcitrate dehydratase PrpD